MIKACKKLVNKLRILFCINFNGFLGHYVYRYNLSHDEDVDDIDECVTAPNIVWFVAASLCVPQECCPILAKYGADFNAIEPETRYRPLELVMKKSGDTERAKAFIDNGSDVNLPFSSGNTPLLHILECDDLFDCVISDMQVPWIDLFASYIDNLELKDSRGESALYKTVRNCAWKCAYTLLKNGASLWAEEWFVQRENILDKAAINQRKRRSRHKDESYQLNQLQKLYDYFFKEQMSLKFISRVAVRKQVVRPRNDNIERLPIPRTLIGYMKNLQL